MITLAVLKCIYLHGILRCDMGNGTICVATDKRLICFKKGNE
jgi:hypothetical protein